MNVNGFYISLRHTEKVVIDTESHRLPPDLGAFTEYKVADYFCPKEWSNNGYFVSVEEGMPLWIDLRCNPQCACVLSVQRFNPISNEPANLEEGLKKDPKQNYMVLPHQRWIDGYTKDGKVYQFVITKAGEGLAVNEYVLPKEMQDSHAIGLAFYLPKHPTHHQRGLAPLCPPFHPKPDFAPNKSPEVWKLIGNPLKGISLQGVKTTLSSDKLCDVYTPPYTSDTTEIYTCSSPSYTMDNDVSRSVNMVNMHDNNIDSAIDRLDESIDFDKASMGAGGRIEQEIVTDINTPDFYQTKPALVMPIYLALPHQFNHIIKQGKRQDAHKKDQFVHSGKIGGVQVPLIS